MKAFDGITEMMDEIERKLSRLDARLAKIKKEHECREKLWRLCILVWVLIAFAVVWN